MKNMETRKKLRTGYTTGTCAALAAKAAAEYWLSGKMPQTVSVDTPKGVKITVCPMDGGRDDTGAMCWVRKDGGDDIDATHGMRIGARVEPLSAPETGVLIEGGEGVGVVTKPGLDQPVGNAAINRVPRAMISQAVQDVCIRHHHKNAFRVVIFAEGGCEIAKKTFNPHLGIVGGISILGTSGIVEPMSVQALVDTIDLCEKQAAALGKKHLILTPGNYGESFLQENRIASDAVATVKCSNFIGEALDMAAEYGFSTVLLVGHVGKLVKLAGGIMNTHSRWADCRTELICAHAAVCGAGRVLCQELMQAATTDACLELLGKAGLQEQVMDSLLAAIQAHLERRAAGAYRVGAVLFSNEHGELGRTKETEDLIHLWK